MTMPTNPTPEQPEGLREIIEDLVEYVIETTTNPVAWAGDVNQAKKLEAEQAIRQYFAGRLPEKLPYLWRCSPDDGLDHLIVSSSCPVHPHSSGARVEMAYDAGVDDCRRAIMGETA